MTEKEIQKLGFKKQVVKDLDHSFYYYTLDFRNGLSFISNANDEVKNEEWFVEFFDVDPEIFFTEFKEFKTLINLLSKKKIK
jgi:hypothetical protein